MSAGAGYRSLFSNRLFTFYFASSAAGDAGYAVYAIAVLWLALQTTGSLLVAGVVLAVEFGIYSLSFTAGPFIDRVRNLRSILLVGYPAQAVLAFLLGLLAFRGELTIPALLAIVVVISFLWNFTFTATLAIPPRIVPANQLFVANGLQSAISGGNQLAGYAAGAGLILLVGPAGGAFLYAALNVAGALLAIPVSLPRPDRPRSGVLREFADGWRFLLSGTGRPLLQLSIFSAMEAFFSTAFVLLIALLAATRFPDPSASYGELFTAFAVGGVVGSLALGQLNPRQRVGTILIGVTVGEGVGIVLATAVAPNLLPSIVAWFLVGLVEIGFWTTLLVYLQATTPGALLGRTLSDAYVFRGSSRAAGALVVGALGGLLAPLAIAGIVGGTFVAVAIVGPLALPAVRRLGF